MTKIPSVVEVVEAIRQRHIHLKANNPVGFVHLFADIKKALTADRTALLTELREYVNQIAYHDDWDCHVLDYDKIKTHLDELIKATSI
jgi:hypothetical protein